MSTFTDSPTRALRVLTISDLYPNARQPQLGIFIEHQTLGVAAYSDVVVVSPTRLTPPLSIVTALPSARGWRDWRSNLAAMPTREQYHGVPVYRPRYVALPKQLHGLWGFLAYPALLPLLRRLHQEHPFDVIHAHNAAPNGLIGMLARRWLKIPLVVSVHGLDLTLSLELNPVGRATIKPVLRSSDLVLANSRRTAAELVRAGAPSERVHLVYYGGNGDIPAAAPAPAPRAPDAPFHLLSVSRLVEWKGIQNLLAALRRLVDAGVNLKYTAVGDGDYRERLEALCRELRLEQHVHFAGAIPREEIWRAYAECDLFVLPSHWETFGIVYLEALSQGKAVVACDTSGAADIHSMYPDGVELTTPNNVDGIVEAIRHLMEEPARRERVRTAGPRFVAERFTWDRTARETLALYHDVLNPSAPGIQSAALPLP